MLSQKNGIIIKYLYVLLCLSAIAMVQAMNKEQIIFSYTADRYQPPSFDIVDPEKYYYPVALARFHKYGLNDSLANQYVSSLGTRGVFHFATVGLVRILYQFPDAPAVKQGFISILEHQLEGNLWTSEGTENHLHMERTSGLLIAQAAMKYLPHKKEETTYKYEMTKEWVLKWAKGLYTHGEGEWEWSGKTKTPYTQHVQHKNVLIQMTLTPVDIKGLTCRIHQIVDQWRIWWAKDYKKRFSGIEKNNVVTQRPVEQLNFENASFINIPKTPYTFEGQLLIADLETVFLVVHFFNNPQFISVSDSIYKNRLIIADKAPLGKLCGYVAEVIEKTAYPTLAILHTAVKNKNCL